MVAAIAVNGATLEPGAPVALFQARIWGGTDTTTEPHYDVASDGRFLIKVRASRMSATSKYGYAAKISGPVRPLATRPTIVPTVMRMPPGFERITTRQGSFGNIFLLRLVGEAK